MNNIPFSIINPIRLLFVFRVIYIWGLICFFSASAGAEILKSWDYNKADNSQVLFFQGQGHSFQNKTSDLEKTPNGNNSLEIKITSGDDNVSYRKQITFLSSTPLLKGGKYRLSFYYKGSSDGEVELNVSENIAPYRSLARSAYRKIKVSTEWEFFSLTFEVEDTFAPPYAAPRIMIGNYPAGQTLYFGPVTLEWQNPVISPDLSSLWKYIPGQCAIDGIPDEAKNVNLSDNSIDIAKLFNSYSSGDYVTLYNEFESLHDGIMQLGMSADWWMEVFVNGKSVFSTMKQGNLSHAFIPEDHVIDIPVKKGKNLLCIYVKAGSKGWKFVCGKVKYMSNPLKDKLFKPKASPEFRPVNGDKFFSIIPGSILDFSNIAQTPVPCGAAGRLIINGKGQLVFDQELGRPVRFVAFNWIVADWPYKVHLWQRDDVVRFADAVKRRGYNMVRFHYNDTFLMGFKIHKRPLKKLSDIKIPETASTIEFDPHNLDVFDMLVAEFKKRGIYINLDLLSAKTGYTIANPWGEPVKYTDTFKTRLFTDQSYRNNWRAAVEFLMNRENPYTGLKLKDDPTLACVNFINEQDLRIRYGLEFFNGLFKEYLKEKYHSDAELSSAWSKKVSFNDEIVITEEILRGNDVRAMDAGMFLTGRMSEMSDWFYNTLLETGYKGLFTHWDMIMRNLEIPVRSKMPVIAQHTYFSHPHKLPAANIIEKSRNNIYVNNHDGDYSIEQLSSLDSSYFRAAAVARFLDRPYMMTEYSHSAFNRFRHERGLYFGSYASLQGWSALTAHGGAVKLRRQPFLTFENGLDPISIASESVTMFAFLRQDIMEAPHSIGLVLESRKLFPGHLLDGIGDDYAKLAMLTKIGLLYPEGKSLIPVGEINPTISLTPEVFSTLKITQWYASADNTDRGQTSKLVQLLKDKNILKDNNPSNPKQHLYYSETGQMVLDGQEKTMTVISPRLEGAIIKNNKTVVLDTMSILNASCPACISIIAINKNETLENGKKLLLIVATNAFNTGMVFNDERMNICHESGDFPSLIQSIKAEIVLNNHNGAPSVYALNMDGSRAEQVDSEMKKDRLHIFLDGSKLKYGTPYFEIVYQ
jgi:hypothetical protein